MAPNKLNVTILFIIIIFFGCKSQLKAQINDSLNSELDDYINQIIEEYEFLEVRLLFFKTIRLFSINTLENQTWKIIQTLTINHYFNFSLQPKYSPQLRFIS